MQENVRTLFTDDEWSVLPKYGAKTLEEIANVPLKLEKDTEKTDNADK